MSSHKGQGSGNQALQRLTLDDETWPNLLHVLRLCQLEIRTTIDHEDSSNSAGARFYDALAQRVRQLFASPSFFFRTAKPTEGTATVATAALPPYVLLRRTKGKNDPYLNPTQSAVPPHSMTFFELKRLNIIFDRQPYAPEADSFCMFLGPCILLSLFCPRASLTSISAPMGGCSCAAIPPSRCCPRH